MINNNISNENKAGQCLMVGFNGTQFNDRLKFLIDTIKVGGIILFSRNISSPSQLKELCLSIQKYADSIGQLPLFIAIDQEGGQVARLKEPFTIFQGNPSIKEDNDAIYFAQTVSKELKEVNINMNLAPVMDIAPIGIKSIMEKRVFGNEPEIVSKLGSKVIKYLQKNKIMAVAKHFPGIGRTILDSHLDLPKLDTDFETIKNFDLIPFHASIEQNVAGIMLSHIIYEKIDPDFPASLSMKIVKDILRTKLGYNGVVMTDDLDMGAIEKYYEFETSIKKILEASVDIILICHESPKIEKAYKIILNFLKESENIKNNIEESYNRILNLKKLFI